MKQLIVCLIFLICIDYIYLECYESNDGLSVEKSVCLKRTVGTSEKSAADGHNPDTCCFYETSFKLNGEKTSSSYCQAFEKSKVPDYVKEMKKKSDDEDSAEVSGLKVTDAKLSIDCSSSFLKFGLLILSIILF